jgi:hypothetical protein
MFILVTENRKHGLKINSEHIMDNREAATFLRQTALLREHLKTTIRLQSSSDFIRTF